MSYPPPCAHCFWTGNGIEIIVHIHFAFNNSKTKGLLFNGNRAGDTPKPKNLFIVNFPHNLTNKVLFFTNFQERTSVFPVLCGNERHLTFILYTFPVYAEPIHYQKSEKIEIDRNLLLEKTILKMANSLVNANRPSGTYSFSCASAP